MRCLRAICEPCFCFLLRFPLEQLGPPPSRNAPVPFYQLTVLPAITNVGDKAVNLQGLKARSKI